MRERCEDARTRRNVGAGVQRKPSLHFCIVYPDRHGQYVIKDLGMVHDGERDTVDLRGEAARTLSDAGYQAGDYLDVAVVPPR